MIIDFDQAMQRIYDVTNTRTQQQVAAALGIRQSSIADAKKRHSIPDTWLVKLLDKYKAHPDWIRYGKSASETGAPIPPVTHERPSWNAYFMSMALHVSQRSTCSRRKVGAIAVKDKRILATGYNGAPQRLKDCLSLGCLRQQLGIPSGERHELCRGIHAEQNVIIQAAIHGIRLDGADLFCTNQPCFICTKMIINCGIKSVYYTDPYPDAQSQEMFQEAGVQLFILPK